MSEGVLSKVVMSVDLDKNCAGCRAAARALDGWRQVQAKAMAKIRELTAENIALRKAECRNCKFDGGNDTCLNPKDQCGSYDRMMWEPKEAS